MSGSFDQLVGEREHGLRDCEAERLCSSEIDDQLVPRRLLNRQIARRGARKDPADIDTSLTHGRAAVRTVT